MNLQELEEILAWLKENANGVQYGQIAITVTFHDGNVRKIDKSVTLTERPLSVTPRGGQ